MQHSITGRHRAAGRIGPTVVAAGKAHRFSRAKPFQLNARAPNNAPPRSRSRHPTSRAAKTDRRRPQISLAEAALALVRGTIMPQHVADEAFRNPELQRLSAVLSMGEDDYANRLFPHQRVARAEITLHNNQIFMSEWFEPKWDATAPTAQVELEDKFHSYASPILGQSRTNALHQAVFSLDKTEAQNFFHLLSQPIN